MSTQIKTGVVRLSYASVWEPRTIANNPNSKPKYSCSLIIPKSDTATISQIKAAIEEAKQAGIPKWGGKIPSPLKMPLRDGDVDRADDPAYENSYFINATSNEAPDIVDGKRKPITDPMAVYSGCYIRALVNFYPFNANGNKGIACGLQCIQFWHHGEPLNGRVRAEDAFDDLDEEDTDDFLD